MTASMRLPNLRQARSDGRGAGLLLAVPAYLTVLAVVCYPITRLTWDVVSAAGPGGSSIRCAARPSAGRSCGRFVSARWSRWRASPWGCSSPTPSPGPAAASSGPCCGRRFSPLLDERRGQELRVRHPAATAGPGHQDPEVGGADGRRRRSPLHRGSGAHRDAVRHASVCRPRALPERARRAGRAAAGGGDAWGRPLTGAARRPAARDGAVPGVGRHAGLRDLDRVLCDADRARRGALALRRGPGARGHLHLLRPRRREVVRAAADADRAGGVRTQPVRRPVPAAEPGAQAGPR